MDTKALRQKILDLAIHGKLVPQDPNDEPASVLLERIRAEKERLIKEGKIKKGKKSAKTSDKPHYPFELPKGWVWTTLSEITSIIGDGLHGTPLYDLTGRYFFINGNNLANRKIIIKEDTKRVSDEEYIKYRKVLNESTILVSINGTIGNVGTYNGEKVILGKSACYFNLLPFIIKDYICNIIESDYFRKYALNSATGSTIKNVPLQAINCFYVPIPPLEEQKRIVKSIEYWLSFVDCIADNKEKLQDSIKQAKSKVLNLAIHGKLVPQNPNDEPAVELLKRINPKAEIITDNGHYQKLPVGWTICRLKDISKIVTGSTPSKSNCGYYGGIFPFFKPADLDAGRHVYKAAEYLSEDGKRASRVVPKGTTAICCIGTIGKVGYLMYEGATNQQINCAIPSKVVDSVFLFYLCASPLFNDKLNSESSAVTISIVNKSKIEAISVPLPPLAEQKRIVSKIEDIFAQLEAIETAL